MEPRFDRIEKKQTEHDERFRDILGHFDLLYQRLTRLEVGEIKLKVSDPEQRI